MLRQLIVAIALGVAPVAAAQDCDTGDAIADCDDDGFSTADGDCDDTDPDVHPDATEICGNRVDDDCDGRDDEAEGCIEAVTEGTLGGGSTCAGSGGWAFLLLAPPLLWRRRPS